MQDIWCNAAITTDIMVGFPGETFEEFEKTRQFVETIDFADAHVFRYSPRKGTPAAKMQNQVSPQTKEQRSKTIEAICHESRDRFLIRHLGKTVSVLFEQPARKPGYFEGKTSNYITVAVKTSEDLSGIYKNVTMESIEDGVIYGTICE